MIVYLARNRVNGKGYVGKTERALEVRQKEHHAAARQGSMLAFHCALRKHGVDSFEWTTLMELSEFTDKDEARQYLNTREREFIRLFETFGPRGYNLTEGGDGGTLPGRIVGKETRIKNAAAAKKRYAAGHGVLMRSRRKKGAEHPFAGKGWGRKGPLSDETKRKLAVAHTGKKLTQAHRAAISAGCKGKPGPKLGTTWSASERSKHSALCYLKKKPVFGYDRVGTCVVAYLSLEDAVIVTGLGQRVLVGNRKKYKLKYNAGITYRRSEMTIGELREKE